MAHCNFSFLMELYKAWGGRTNQGSVGQSWRKVHYVPQCQSSEPSLPYRGEGRIEGEGSRE